jgi:hypothetical protein
MLRAVNICERSEHQKIDWQHQRILARDRDEAERLPLRDARHI